MAKKSAAQKSPPVVEEAEVIVEPAPAFLDAGVIIEPEVMRTAVEDSLPLDRVFPSPTNPRQDLGDLTELAESIKKAGILQPVLVRTKRVSLEHADPAVDEYELIFGHRRAAAARLAGLTHIPARIIQLDDQQVLELQLIENAQRRDISPLEEATAYRRLHDEFGLSADAIAQRVGKSKASVYARMKLGDLKDDHARIALAAGRIDASLALLIARLSPADQTKATPVILGDKNLHGYKGDGKPMSYREAQEHLRDGFYRHVADARFDASDASLIPSAGACTKCPKRVDVSGLTIVGQKIGDGDLCDDASCWSKKVITSRDHQLAAKIAKGFTPIPESQNRKMISEWSDELQLHGSDYRKFNDEIGYEYTKAFGPYRHKWGTALGAAAKKLDVSDEEIRKLCFVALDGKNRAVELVNVDGAWKLIKKAGVVKVKKSESSRSGGSGVAKAKPNTPEAKLIAGAEKHIEAYVVEALRSKAEPSPEIDARMLRFFIGDSMMAVGEDFHASLKSIDPKLKLSGLDSFDTLAKISASTLRAIGAMAILSRLREDMFGAREIEIDAKSGKVKLGEALREAAKVLGVDVAAIETKATADVVRELAKLKAPPAPKDVPPSERNPFRKIATDGRKAVKKITAKPKAKK